MQADVPTAADHNGYQQIIRPSRGMREGLKSQEAVARASIEVEYPKVAAMTLLSWPDQGAAQDDLGDWSPPLARKKGGCLTGF